MNIIESTSIALNGLKANKLRSGLTMLGIIIGVVAITLLISIALGVRSKILGEIQSIGSNAFVVIPGNVEEMKGPPEFLAVNKLTLRDVFSIRQRSIYPLEVAPILISSAPIRFGGGKSYTALVMGVTEEFPSARGWKAERGRFISKQDFKSARKVCLIGRTIVRSLFKGGDPIEKSLLIKGQRFKIIGVMEPKGYMFNFDQDDIVFLPLSTAQDFFGVSYINRILVKVSDPKIMDEAMEMTKKILLRRLDPEDFSVKSQAEIFSLFQTITAILTVALGSIAGISLVVGGIGIMNIMLVSVTERTREIGIRKAVGAYDLDILIQFLTESAVLSFFGGLLGILVSYLFSFALSSFASFTIPVAPLSILISLGFSILVGVFFGVYPASKAARLDPITALRYE